MARTMFGARKRRTGAALFLLAAAALFFSSCERESEERQSLTILTYGRDLGRFEAALNEAYPEVRLEVLSYDGHNPSTYALERLKAGKVCDIFVIRSLPSADLQKANLYDLSGETFLDNFNQSLLLDLSEEGALYLVPVNYSFRGITYNKSLFERHGWKAPESMEELDALVPQIRAAGVTVSEVCTEFPSASFNFFFDVASPAFFSTIEGIRWTEDITQGVTDGADVDLTPALDAFYRGRDLGMFGIQNYLDRVTREKFAEGNTAFMLADGTFDLSSGNGDEYALLPYLSEDGSNNITITQTDSYFGINAALENNPQKLSDALKVLSFIATAEGQETLAVANNTLSSLSDTEVNETSPLYASFNLMLEGRSLSLPSSGWENIITPIGNAAYGMMEGTVSREEMEALLNAAHDGTLAREGESPYLVSDTDLSSREVASLVGTAYLTDMGTDAALISLGGFHGHGKVNPSGVNAAIYRGEVLTPDAVCTFNPLGWTDTIRVLTLTGAQIKEIAAEGYFADGDETPFEYVLVTRDGNELSDERLYTVACTTESADRAREGNLMDTHHRGQDAILNYLGTIQSLKDFAAVQLDVQELVNSASR